MGLLHRLIPWAYSVDELEAYYIGLLISTHVLRNKHVLINKPTLDEQTQEVMKKLIQQKNHMNAKFVTRNSRHLKGSNYTKEEFTKALGKCMNVIYAKRNCILLLN